MEFFTMFQAEAQLLSFVQNKWQSRELKRLVRASSFQDPRKLTTSKFYHAATMHCHWKCFPESLSSPFVELRMFDCHEYGDVSSILTLPRKFLPAFSPNPISSSTEESSDSVSCIWPQPPTLTISEPHQTQFEELLFSPAVIMTSPLHLDRIEEFLFSPTSPVNEPMYPRGHSHGFHILQPLPRSFVELHAERSYLLSCLQTEDDKATELLRLIPPLEESLIQKGERFYRRRKATKRLGWLKRRLDETNRQERRIVTRLGQVFFEIQARERWTQIEFEHRQYETELYFAEGCHGMQPRQLDPTSPTFQHAGYLLPSTPWPTAAPQECKSQNGQEGYRGSFWTANQRSSAHLSQPTAECSTGDQISPKDASPTSERPGTIQTFRKSQLTHRPSSLNDVSEPLGVLSTNTSFTTVPNTKRLSLPRVATLLIPVYPGVWTTTTEEKKLEIQDDTVGDTVGEGQEVGSSCKEGTVRENISE